VSQVIDFARFIEWQVSESDDDDLLDDSKESEEEIRASEEKCGTAFWLNPRHSVS
jgi:hypothetical protein